MEQLNHKTITASYQMYDISDHCETLLEATPDDQPLRFITEFGLLPIPAMEEALAPLATGDDFSLSLTPDEAFGPRQEEGVMELPKHIFNRNGEFDSQNVRQGVVIPLSNGGKRFLATVVEIGQDTVTVDANHPLAGKPLLIKGTVIDSHPSTEDEILALLNQLNAHSCSGGCSGSCGNCGQGHCGEGNCGEGHCGEGCGNCNHGE